MGIVIAFLYIILYYNILYTGRWRKSISKEKNKNDENIVLIENPEIAKFYKDFFLYQWNQIDNKWLYKNVRAESKESLGSCYDGLDNNYDGLTDLEDPACK